MLVATPTGLVNLKIAIIKRSNQFLTFCISIDNTEMKGFPTLQSNQTLKTDLLEASQLIPKHLARSLSVP